MIVCHTNMEQFAAFDPATEESYYTSFQFYLQVIVVTNLAMKRATVFSFCRQETCDAAQPILAPEQIAEMAFNTDMGRLKDYLLQPSKITCHHAFYTRA